MINYIIWVLGAIIGILMIKMIFKITESKDSIYRMFVENDLQLNGIYGLTEKDKRKLKKHKREAFFIFALGLLFFILVVTKDKI